MPLVPFNLAVLAVFLCGSLLPKGAALLSQLCYLLLGSSAATITAIRFQKASPAHFSMSSATSQAITG